VCVFYGCGIQFWRGFLSGKHIQCVLIGSSKWWWKIVPQFWSAGSKAAWSKLHVRQASTCKSRRAAEHRWRQLILTVTGMHSSWRYCGAVWWRHLKMIVQSSKTIRSGTGNQWRSSRSVGVMHSNFRFHIMSRAADANCLRGGGVYLIQQSIAVD